MIVIINNKKLQIDGLDLQTKNLFLCCAKNYIIGDTSLIQKIKISGKNFHSEDIEELIKQLAYDGLVSHYFKSKNEKYCKISKEYANNKNILAVRAGVNLVFKCDLCDSYTVLNSGYNKKYFLNLKFNKIDKCCNTCKKDNIYLYDIRIVGTSIYLFQGIKVGDGGKKQRIIGKIDKDVIEVFNFNLHHWKELELFCID